MILTSLKSLQTSLEPLSALPPNIPASAPAPRGDGAKAWELGRQAYLNWAVGKAVGAQHGAGAAGAGDGIDQMERMMVDHSGSDGMEKLARSIGA